MKKRSIVLVVLSLIVLGGFASIFITQIKSMSQTPPEMLNLVPGDSYEKDWERVDSLQREGLPQSALDLVHKIYDKAIGEKNHAQQIKSVIHILKFNSWVEEEALVKNIDRVKKEIEKAEFPVRPVMQSLLAQHYWDYFQRNTWRFANRSETDAIDEADPRTWDLRKIVDESSRYYLASLENADSLQRTPVGYLAAVLDSHPDFRKYRPTLYDLLAHRALEVFRNDVNELTKPAFAFHLSGAEAFANDRTFADHSFESKDSTSFKLIAVRILQDLTRAHLNDESPEAAVALTLDRLEFAHEESTEATADSMYRKALEQLEQKHIDHPVSAMVSHMLASALAEEASEYDPLDADQSKKLLRSKALEICQAAIKRHPGSIGAGRCANLAARLQAKSLEVRVENINLPGQPFRSLLSYQNLDKVWCKVVKVDDRFRRKMEGEDSKDMVKALRKLPAVHAWSVDLPKDADLNTHRTEMAVPATDKGYYALLVADNSDFAFQKQAVNYAMFWSSRLAYASRTARNDGEVEYVLTDRETGSPLPNVKAQAYIREYNYDKRRYDYKAGAIYQSDKNGFFSIKGQSSRYSNFYLEFTLDGERIRTDDSWYLYGSRNQEERRIRRTVFFTDRGIYRPGQTIYFKAIVLETYKGKTSIVPGYSTYVALNDPNWQEVAKLKLKTNEFGTFHGSFTAPQGGLNGAFTLQEEHGGTSVRVEDYKRPKFEVVFDPVKGSFRLNDQVKVSGQAKAYAGSNIDGAEVKYRVVRRASFPYWGYWFWGRIMPNSPEMEILSGTTTTDGEGKFEVEFQAIPDPGISPDLKPQFNYTVHADVVDITGETHSASANANVGYIALAADLKVPAELEKGRKDGFAIVTKNLNGQFEAARGRITVHQLDVPDRIFRNRLWSVPDKFVMSRAEYYDKFPNDIYQQENEPQNWKRGKKVYDEAFDSEKEDSLELKRLSRWDEGKYVVEMLTNDKFGTEVKVVKYFTLFDAESAKVPLPVTEWFVANKRAGEPGEKIDFEIGTAEKTLWVLFEVEKKDRLVRREWVKLDREKRDLEMLIEEADRGNFVYHLSSVKHGRLHGRTQTVSVPWTNKKLEIHYETFRDKLQPGEKETWNLRISGPGGEAAAAEMVAGMYDASLDAFASVYWGLSVNPTYYSSRHWSGASAFSETTGRLVSYDWNEYPRVPEFYFEYLNLFDYQVGYSYRRRIFGSSGRGMPMKKAADYDGEVMEESEGLVMMDSMAAAPPPEAPGGGKREEKERGITVDGTLQQSGEMDKDNADLGEVSVRTNLNETAFFFPELRTNEKGEIILSYTVPEALTRWRIMMLAHTKDLKTGYEEKSLVTQKELMVMPNPPRFFRENDVIEFTAKVSNLSDKDLSGVASLELFDALTMKPIDAKMANDQPRVNFTVKKERSTPLSWRLKIPSDVQMVTYRVKAAAGNFSDGEESTLPVLRNSMLVTESMPLPVRPKETRTFTFDKLINNKSTTLQHHKYTLEFTSNPAWYAVQALPYLMEYPYECTEQIFSRYYANALASHIANSHPRIKRVFDAWSSTDRDALLSNLEKNQELKALLLEETPWVLQAQSESERKKRVGLLFDLNKMADELSRALNKIQKAQSSNGGWPWFPGMRESRYITQHVVTGMGHLDHLGVKAVREDKKTWQMVEKAVRYLDTRIREDYEDLLKYKRDLSKMQIGNTQIQFLYARSYFPDIPIAKANEKAIAYYRTQAQEFWGKFGKYQQGMIALGLHRSGDEVIPAKIVKSLKEHALHSDEMGMYWKRADRWCLYWYQAPIETQALLIEVFDEVADDQESVEEMKIWLLKQKQTQDWKTTKATVEACYALLLRGTDLLAESEIAEVSIGGKVYDPLQDPTTKVEAGTGYFKTSWGRGEITPEMGEVKVVNKNNVVAWGAVYWQYFEQLDKITWAETNLKLQKKLFLEENSPTGPKITPVTEKTKLKPGDKLKVRIILESDRDLEYVHLKDMRASGFEPINVLSQYKYQDGLGYYESTRDAATNFFISYLRKGKYVFEYPLRVIHNGDFSNGISTIQCMYAPEFTSHSEGVRVKVGE
jgi:uncharacterized protein YfaS (alpha-2-macroglobulin family)